MPAIVPPSRGAAPRPQPRLCATASTRKDDTLFLFLFSSSFCFFSFCLLRLSYSQPPGCRADGADPSRSRGAIRVSIRERARARRDKRFATARPQKPSLNSLPDVSEASNVPPIVDSVRNLANVSFRRDNLARTDLPADFGTFNVLTKEAVLFTCL